MRKTACVVRDTADLSAKRWRDITPLWPAGHLPRKGGDQLSSRLSPISSVASKRLDVQSPFSQFDLIGASRMSSAPPRVEKYEKREVPGSCKNAPPKAKQGGGEKEYQKSEKNYAIV